jgi:hypothetical protein
MKGLPSTRSVFQVCVMLSTDVVQETASSASLDELLSRRVARPWRGPSARDLDLEARVVYVHRSFTKVG